MFLARKTSRRGKREKRKEKRNKNKNFLGSLKQNALSRHIQGMKTNLKFKASLFTFLFSDTEVLRELYSALEGISLPNDVPVTINTLEDVLFMDRVNDISFEIGGKLVVLIEHQSTINPNMALRLLMYIARLYERLIGNKNIYSTKRIALPWPEFFVLYNGEAPYPDEQVLRLSDAFLDPSELGVADRGPALELEVKVLNINKGRNEGIARGCKTLAGYQAFVAKVREYLKQGDASDGARTGSLEDALKKAVLYCRDHGILKEFLEHHATEVIGMLTAEWNLEDAKAVWFEEGMEMGMEKGMERGTKDVARNALAEGLPLDVVQKITGLDAQAIEKLRELVENKK